MSPMHVPQGTFSLERHPVTRDATLRAWDAADELVLHHLAATDVALSDSSVIIDGAFGALTTALARSRPTTMSDSYLAHRATRLNLARNAIEPRAAAIVASSGHLCGPIDVLIVKVPKVLALLEDQLRRLRPHLHTDTVVLGAAMTRHIHTSTLEVFERVIGPAHTSRAQRKARLIHATVDPDREPGPWPWPHVYAVPGDGVTVVNEAGVFSASSLDIGTRVLLEHLPADRSIERIIDLGCGNGVVGATAQMRNPDAHVTFVDESLRAIASAEQTHHATFAGSAARGPAVRFVAGDGLFDLADGPTIEPDSVDLVLTNPPFHHDHVTGDETAWMMFTQARAALRPAGELWVIGNRHLDYHTKLRRLFDTVDVVASTPKFVLCRASRA